MQVGEGWEEDNRFVFCCVVCTLVLGDISVTALEQQALEQLAEWQLRGLKKKAFEIGSSFCMKDAACN